MNEKAFSILFGMLQEFAEYVYEKSDEEIVISDETITEFIKERGN